MGFWICWYFLSLWVPNYTFQYRIHYHDATTSPPNPESFKLSDSGLIRLTNYPLSYQPLFWFVRWIRLAFGKMDSIFFNTMYTNLCNPKTP
jgi:hypothetical protein